jgi:hypothetical protein
MTGGELELGSVHFEDPGSSLSAWIILYLGFRYESLVDAEI